MTIGFSHEETSSTACWYIKATHVPQPKMSPRARALNCPRMLGLFLFEADLFFRLAVETLLGEVPDFFFFREVRFLGEDEISDSNFFFPLFSEECGFNLFSARTDFDFAFEDDVFLFEFGKMPP